MSEVVLSSAVRSNLLNLQSTAELLGKTQTRLATGKKVNSALDNPTNFFTASSLNSRAADLARLLDSVSNAIQTISAADKGISAINKLVESAQATARQALQTTATIGGTAETTASDTTSDIDSLAVTGAAATAATLAGGAFTTVDISTALDEITFDLTVDGGTPTSITIDTAAVDAYNLANTTTLDDAALTAQDVVDLINDQAGATIASLNGGNIDLTSTTQGLTSEVEVANFVETATGGGTGLADGTDTGAAGTGNAGTVTINGETITLASGDDGADFLAALTTAAATATGTNAFEFTNDNGVITISGTDGNDLVVSGTTTSLTAVGLAAGTINGTAAVPGTPNPKRDELRVQYNELLTQVDALAKDAGFNGVNLLNGDNLSVLFNEDGSSKLDITGVTYSAAGLGLQPLLANAFDTNTGINSVLDDLKAGTDTLRTQSAKFGSNLSVVEARQNFTKEMINVLETGAANLTLADTNEEAANLLALQTRQQLSSTALSLASQSDQNVLRLF